jgi:hypothetical protein
MTSIPTSFCFCACRPYCRLSGAVDCNALWCASETQSKHVAGSSSESYGYSTRFYRRWVGLVQVWGGKRIPGACSYTDLLHVLKEILYVCSQGAGNHADLIAVCWPWYEIIGCSRCYSGPVARCSMCSMCKYAEVWCGVVWHCVLWIMDYDMPCVSWLAGLS